MKKETYNRDWNPTPNEVGYKKEFEDYWRKRTDSRHKGKLISLFVERYGDKILDTTLLSLANIMKTPLEKVQKFFENVENNLSNETKQKISMINKESSNVDFNGDNNEPNVMDPSPPESRPISKIDLTSLEKEKWFNDTEIHLYLRYFLIHSNISCLKDIPNEVYIFDPKFSTLEKEKIDVKKYVDHLKLANKNILLMPLNLLGNHWALLIFDVPKRKT